MTVARRHRLAIEAALLALIAYLAALGVSAAVRVTLEDVPLPPPAPTRAEQAPAPALADYAVIAERDIFNPPHDGGPAPAPGGGTALRLWGVAFQGREARAVIEDTATHRQDLYRVGDHLGGARIAAIDWDRVTLERGGAETTLDLLPPPRAAPAPPGAAEGAEAPPRVQPRRDERIRRTGEDAYLVDRRELAGAVDNLSGLLTQLRSVAEVRDGRPAGFRLFQIREGSLFQRLGLRDGDVVQRVNGRPIEDPAALLGFLNRLQTEPRVALDIVRAKAPRTLVYDLR
jgi:general secretion pathway protein C